MTDVGPTKKLNPETILSPFEIAIQAANELARKSLAETIKLSEFMRLTQAVRSLTSQQMAWMREYYADVTDLNPQIFLDFFEREENKTVFQREAQTALSLFMRNSERPPQEGKARVTVIKFLNPKSRFWEYRALGKFLGDCGTYDVSNDRELNGSALIAIYTHLHAPCNFQACEAVLNGEEIADYEVANLDINELYRALDFNPNQVQQNFRVRDFAGQILGHTNEQLYLLFAIKGGFSNETDRCRITDFLYRK